MITPSKYQINILNAVQKTKDNVVIQACAGSGKTTTLKMICEKLCYKYKILAVCFNKLIADDFKHKLPDKVESKTLHSLGFSIIRDSFYPVLIDNNKINRIIDNYVENNDYFLAHNFEKSKMYSLKYSIPKLCSIALATMTDLNDYNQLEYLMYEYGLGTEPEAIKFVPDIIKLCRAKKDTICFDDMIDFPLHYDLPIKTKYDIILVDECQDLNAQQLALVKKLVGNNGRIIAVGDRLQGIYGFRGASHTAIDELKSYFNCKELPLSICYRCGSNIVKEAQAIVGETHIQAKDKIKAGIVIKRDASNMQLTLNELASADLVLCRTNAPLVEPCLKLIANHKKAIIRGRDIGKGLVASFKNITKRRKIKDIEEFNKAIDEWERKEKERLIAKECFGAAMRVSDKAETLKVIAKNADDFNKIPDIIENIFSDENQGIVFSTIHKAKGLEANNVVILGPELIPHKMALKTNRAGIIKQEYNLDYVARTRAKNKLIYQPITWGKK